MNKILLIGAGPMAEAYVAVFQAMQVDFDVAGRSQTSAQNFETKTGKKVFIGAEATALFAQPQNYAAVIVAISMEQLASVTTQLLENNFKTILVEKPGGLNAEQINTVANLAQEKKATVLLAYNRRFYSSVFAAEQLIEKDGGITSFHFEFTEWNHVIAPLPKADGVKENWFLGNSTHVVDLAFYLGGSPANYNCYQSGSLPWHTAAAVFTGSGVTDKKILFSYCANWLAPGRWGVELMTNHHRLILKPMEKLQIQKTGSVAIEEFAIDDSLDKQFKPGLYKQVEAFLQADYSRFATIQHQAEAASGVYKNMVGK